MGDTRSKAASNGHRPAPRSRTSTTRHPRPTVTALRLTYARTHAHTHAHTHTHTHTHTQARTRTHKRSMQRNRHPPRHSGTAHPRWRPDREVTDFSGGHRDRYRVYRRAAGSPARAMQAQAAPTSAAPSRSRAPGPPCSDFAGGRRTNRPTRMTGGALLPPMMQSLHTKARILLWGVRQGNILEGVRLMLWSNITVATYDREAKVDVLVRKFPAHRREFTASTILVCDGHSLQRECAMALCPAISRCCSAKTKTRPRLASVYASYSSVKCCGVVQEIYYLAGLFNL